MTVSHSQAMFTEYINGFEPHLRFTELAKLYYAYFLATDEYQKLFDTCIRGVGGAEGAEADAAYKAALPWFKERSLTGFDTFEEFLAIPRPFVWKHGQLLADFPAIMEKRGSAFVYKQQTDYTTAKDLGAGKGLWSLDWLEEYGFIEIAGLLIGRTIQRPVIDDVQGEHVGALGEYIVYAMPAMPYKMLLSQIDSIPAMGGGIALHALVTPVKLNINFADRFVIDNVDTALVCLGRIIQKDGIDSELQEYDPKVYYEASVTLHNGVKLPFIDD